MITRLLLCVFAFVFCSIVSFAQDTTKTKPARKIAYGKSQAIYAEALGNALIYSFNYDTRFTRRHDGLGYRLGVGAFTLGSANETFTLVSFPFGINHLLGKGRFALETGLGVTIINTKNTSQTEQNGVLNFFKDEGYVNYATATLGVRYHPINQGLVFRFALTPFYLFDSKTILPWVGLSFGYGFHN